MIFFGQARAERKHLKAIQHFLRKRSRYGRDVLPEKTVMRLDEAERMAKEALGWSTSAERRGEILRRLETHFGDLLRTDKHHGRRENAEVALVAIALALGVRAYFLQPFKIPTHSMRPTLLGILTEPESQPPPSWPVRIFDLVWRGKSWHRAVAPREGTIVSVREGQLFGTIPWTTTEIVADGWTETIWTGLKQSSEDGSRIIKARAGDRVKAGEVLANFSSTSGDHLFVNKVLYQLRKPYRGETFVFTTDGIEGIESGLRLRGIQGSQYYIKRCVALGGDRLQVRPPILWINGQPALDWACQRVAAQKNGYGGYTLGPTYLTNPEDSYQVPGKDYWAMGDNSGNSYDSRGWGPVPSRNLVGKGAFVYWPFSKRWGVIH
ncbi:MAG: signal peptidase I [Verrucomicrobia bacterium]|nr:signal peptidase I [Verrucomicrobiota bacterium]